MDKNELKQIVIKEVDKLKEDITELGNDIYKHTTSIWFQD